MLSHIDFLVTTTNVTHTRCELQVGHEIEV